MRFFRHSFPFKRIAAMCALLCVVVGLFVWGEAVFAQQATNTFGTDQIQQETILGGEDIRVIVMKIIRAVLSLLGVIALGLMLYGGFVWMTSGGSEEKIGQAKRILTNATIGLVIILSSFAIVQFFLNRFHEAAGGVIPAGPPNDCADPLECQDIVINNRRCADLDFVVTSITPNTPQDNGTGMSNIVVRAILSKPLAGDQDLSQVLSVRKDGEGDPLPLRAARSIAAGYGVEVVIDQDTDVCAADGNQEGCISESNYEITVNKELQDAQGRPLKEKLVCNGEEKLFPQKADFTVNRDHIDRQAPMVDNPIDPISIIPLEEGVQVGRGAQQGFLLERGQEYTVRVKAGDRQNDAGMQTGGMAYMTYAFTQVIPPRGGTARFADGPAVDAGSNGEYTFEAPLNIGARMPTWTVHEIQIQAYDIDHQLTTVTTSITIVGEGCLADPDRPDCQGPPQCEDDRQCPSQKCLNNQCVPWPMITDVSAWDGAGQNLVTISGMNLGDEPGDIAFGYDRNSDGQLQQAEWIPASVAQCEGQDVWHDRWAIVEVPADNAALPLNSTSSIRIVKRPVAEDPEPFIDSTTDQHGPKPGPRQGHFLKNDQARPGLCFVETRPGDGPNGDGQGSAREGFPGNPIRAVGQGFGNGDNSRLLLGGQAAVLAGRWGDREIFASVPNGMASGTVAVSVDLNGVQSNGVPFTIRGVGDAPAEPVIAAVSPSSTTRESYVTITGSGFGEQIGSVWLAESTDAVATCPTPANRHPSCRQLVTQLPAFCGDTWHDDQVIVQLQDTTGAGVDVRLHALLLTTQAGRSTDGTARIQVVAGAPRPSICAVEPEAGPAPLPQGTHMTIRGVNFPGRDSFVYFWKREANLQDVATWFALDLLPDRAGDDVIGVRSADNSEIVTDLPIDRAGVSMPPGPGPIIVGDEERTVLSNPVQYTVESCLDAPRDANGDPVHPRGGDYHCCVEGSEQGLWKRNACEGEIRDAGYVWRFSTGRIPRFPQVLEICDPEQPNILPSPTPATLWRDGRNSCTNSIITIRFTQAIDADSLAENIHVYSCGQAASSTCGRAPEEITDRYRIEMLGNDAFQLKFAENIGGHIPGTWHRITLSQAIQGIAQIQGLDTPERVPLLPTRPLEGDRDVAYYFEFKTGENRCRLSSVLIHPPAYTTTRLGIILDPRFSFNPLYRQYFNLLGRGTQECSVIDPGNGWDWASVRADVARHTVNPPDAEPQSDKRIFVTALQDDGGRVAPITATSNTLGFTATTSISVSLADPEVVSYWPNCSVACPNASVGVRFNREMFIADFETHNVLTLEECLDGETCLNKRNVQLRDLDAITDPFQYEQFIFDDPADPADGALATNTWYMVTVSDQLRAVGEINPDLGLREGRQVRAGRSLRPLHADGSYSWKFRTKAEDEFCILDRTEIEPAAHLATQVGEITPYRAVPLSSPDACSDRGQRLNPWGYGWSWSTTDADAEARVAAVTTIRSSFALAPYCSTACLPIGSNIARGNAAYLCGNGVLDPGEDCEITDEGLNQPIENLGISCTLNCLRPGNPTRLQRDDAGNPLPNQVGACGDGEVNPFYGEECDEDSDLCSETCQWVGSPQQRPDNPNLPWCGSGAKTAQEDCDIGLTLDEAGRQGRPLNESAVGCTQQCLHAGTSLARQFCERFANRQVLGGAQPVLVRDHPLCADARSSCGNGIVEAGEQCETAPGALVYRIPGNNAVQRVAVQNPEEQCSPRCLLQNICAVNQIPLKRNPQDQGLRCLGGPGCRPDCTLAGSSALYSQPSVCGDGVLGYGETAACELPANQVRERDTIGQNPVQLVTAIGDGEVNPETNAQETDILSAPVAVRERNDAVREFDADFQEEHTASGEYVLQCGYSEGVAGDRDILATRDGTMEDTRIGAAGQTGLWVRLGPNDGYVLEKTTSTVWRGNSALHVQVGPQEGRWWGFYQDRIPVAAGRYHVELRYRVERGFLDVWFEHPGRRADRVGIRLHAGENDAQQGVWQTLREEIVVPNGVNLLTIYANTLNGDVYLDEFRVTRVNQETPQVTNDCPNNAFNTDGVATNSCCYPRPVRTTVYPLDGSGLPGAPQDRAAGVCRNTYIEVGFNRLMDHDSLKENIILARGYEDPNHVCAGQGEQDVTSEVEYLLAAATQTNREDHPPGLLQRLWQGVKRFFAGIFQPGVTAAVIQPEHIQVWCSGAAALNPVMRNHIADDGSSVSTTVSLYLQNVLDENAVYAVMLRGGIGGIQDVRGVGMRAAELVPAAGGGQVAPLSELMVFQTSRDICRLQEVLVEPEQYLFTEPNTEEADAPEFFIDTVSTNGQRIVSTPAYEWVWDWIPVTTPLYRIPVAPRLDADNQIVPEEEQTNTPLIKIGATDLEGRLAVAGQARVLVDPSPDSHAGQVFSDITDLQSLFCENPWPPRNVYPYEHGIPYTREENNDAFRAEDGFFGGDVPAIGGEYFNFSLSYCADDGATGTTTDDLPELEPLSTQGGFCQFSRESCQVNDDCPYIWDFNPADNDIRIIGESPYWCNAPQPDNPGVRDAFLLTSKPGTVWVDTRNFDLDYVVSCSSDDSCRHEDRYTDAVGNLRFDFPGGRRPPAAQAERRALIQQATCLGQAGDALIPGTRRDTCLIGEEPKTLDEALLQTVFFNAKNDDVIGLKVYANPDRRTAAQWYASQPFRAAGARQLTIGGADAVTDGNNYFVNFLNVEENRQIRQYILALSINADAQPNTKKVYEQLIDSLAFNINVSDFGYCQLNGAQGADVRLSQRLALQQRISEVPCLTNFDCRDAQGQPKQGTNGLCSNALTKLQNDWQRMQDIQQIQYNLEQYRDRQQSYPPLAGGTYVPQYTNSRWPSWGLLSQTIQGAPLDPINQWSGCGTEDPQTCWSEQQTRFICPAYTNVYEYAFDKVSGEYTIHAPLEYFSPTGGAVREFVDPETFSAEPWCAGQEVSPFLSECGDGILNPESEECDPPGSITRTTDGCADGEARINQCTNTCQLARGECEEIVSCGDGRVDFELGELCDDGVLNGTYGHCAQDCSGPGNAMCGNGRVDGDFELCDVNQAQYQQGYCRDNPARTCIQDIECDPGAFERGDGHFRDVCVHQNTPTYGFNQDQSCSWDCQSRGGYCGDGIRQAEFESCDDGNRTAGDGCSARCRTENLACKANAFFVTSTEPLVRGDSVYADSYTRITVRNFIGNGVGLSNVPGCHQQTTGRQICEAYGLNCINYDNAPGLDCDTDQTGRDGGGWMNLYCAGIYNGTPPQEAAEGAIASCGNGVEEEGEDCDLGDQNGHGCVPGYNQTCIACSADCRTEITVQPTQWCGNNVIDAPAESCEVAQNGTVTAQHPTHGRITSCPNGQVGALSCNPQCQLQDIAETCVLCGVVQNNTGAIPRLAFINPMGSANRDANQPWTDDLRISLYRLDRVRDEFSGVGNRTGNSIDNVHQLFPMFFGYDGFERDRLTTHLLCREEYGVMFNIRQLGQQLGVEEQNGTSIGHQLLTRARPPIGLLPYPVNGESRSVDNDLVVSPAVPQGAVRVVVRWTAAENNTGVSFPGYVYFVDHDADDAVDPERIYSVAKALEPGGMSVSREYAFGGVDVALDEQASWIPNGIWGRGKVAVHPTLHTENTWTQAFTIYAGAYARDTDTTRPYAFFVGAAGGDTNVPMSLFQNSNVTVEVYTHRSGQNNRYSIYPPAHVFRLRQAKRSGNLDAQYWHVFNLVDRGDGFGYGVELVREYTDLDNDGDLETGPPNDHGVISTDWNRVLQNVDASMSLPPQRSPFLSTVQFGDWQSRIRDLLNEADLEGARFGG